MQFNMHFDRGKRRRATYNILDFKNLPTKCIVLCISMLFLIFIWSSLAWATQTCPSILLADNGMAHATIVIDLDATPRVKKAAQVLAEYLLRSTGATFVVTNRPKLVAASQVLILLKDKNINVVTPTSSIPVKDAFCINFPNTKTIVLSGASEVGVEFGVYDFLERFLGVRWLFPGNIGIHIPRHKMLEVPMKNINETPRYKMRLLSGLKTKDELDWASKNRMYNPGIMFHHNLANLFPPEIYAKTHPEFFPIINGKRFIPKPGEKIRWQPCFSASGLADEAANRIIAYFEKNPKVISYSLGVNDGNGYCECSKCLSKTKGNKNYLNRTNYSALYYSWANKVAEEVLSKYPNKWFGCLAYGEVAVPAEYFKVNSRIIPFITYDRIKWVDINNYAEGKKNTGLWEGKASIIGWYDYLYGYRYILPRIYSHIMTDYIRYGANHGVRMMYAEAYPNWGEGPKLYLALRLLWNPDINPDTVLDDWYSAAVGKKAAPLLKHYFDFWENYWAVRLPPTKWFKIKGGALLYNKKDYLENLTQQDMQYCRNMLKNVQSNTVTSEQRKRADYFLSTFQAYEDSIAKSKYEQNLSRPTRGNGLLQ